jgi:hypothetical protein
MNVKFYEWVNERKKNSKRVVRTHQKLTCVGVELTTLCIPVHRSSYFTMNHSTILPLLKIRYAQLNFLIAIFLQMFI